VTSQDGHLLFDKTLSIEENRERVESITLP